MITLQNNTENRKIFCIGFNKTGTTSLEHFMREHGFKCNIQSEGEFLIKNYAKNNWSKIISFCDSAEFFQDLPFSAPKTAKIVLENFPNAKYILTIRGSAEIWYKSMTEFHKIKFGEGGKLPTMGDLITAEYRYKGFAWNANRALFESPANEPYHKATLLKTYEDHIKNTKQLFSGKDNLLIIDISKSDAIERLCRFLGIKSTMRNMPWLNKTSDAKR